MPPHARAGAAVALRSTPLQARIVRDVFSYAHLAYVAGISCIAVGLKKLMAHPGAVPESGPELLFAPATTRPPPGSQGGRNAGPHSTAAQLTKRLLIGKRSLSIAHAPQLRQTRRRKGHL